MQSTAVAERLRLRLPASPQPGSGSADDGGGYFLDEIHGRCGWLWLMSLINVGLIRRTKSAGYYLRQIRAD